MDKAHGLARVYTPEEEAWFTLVQTRGFPKLKLLGKAEGEGLETHPHTPPAPPLLFIITHRLEMFRNRLGNLSFYSPSRHEATETSPQIL